MAKQLYDYWFVQFDFPNEEGKPYKSSGGEMVWNEKLKREIPKEWEIRPLNSLITVKDGTHESPKQQLEGRYLITSKHLLSSGIDYNTAYYISAEDYIAINKRSQVETNDILFSMIGTIGNKYLVAEKNVNFAIKNMALLKTSKSMHIMYFLWLYLSSWDYKHYEFNAISGSIQKFLSLDAMRNIPVPFNYDIAVAFNKQVSNICQCIINLKEENIQLIKQRNELLPLLMNGQVSVNSDLAVSYIIYKNKIIRIMKENIIQAIVAKMQRDLDCRQMARLKAVLTSELHNVEIIEKSDCATQQTQENEHLLNSFISAKKIEGCSDKTLTYYRNTIERLLVTLSLAICHITTTDIRTYLSDYQEEHQSSKVTIDNMRRIFSSFFAWLEDEDYIAKSPVRRIHKVKTDSLVKEVLSDEQLEQLRDSCTTKRDLAIIDFLSSTGIRVGELVKLSREDIDFHERQCVVFGKGNKERVVYFNARTKLHLQQYLNERTDSNPALFVSLNSPHSRLTISGVEVRIRKMGQALSMPKVHPHKFRRTLATMAIDKGMPIEQVQRLLGHVRIDTTLHYAIVNQNNVKLAHKKYLG